MNADFKFVNCLDKGKCNNLPMSHKEVKNVMGAGGREGGGGGGGAIYAR